jgi:hypothetical protein
MKPLLTIWSWKARSVEQARQRRVAGCVRERRRMVGLGKLAVVGESGERGELERDGVVLVLMLAGLGDEDALGGEGEGSVARRRRKGMRRGGRR